MTQPLDPLVTRLVGVAAALDLPGLGPRVEEAVSVALDLLIADRATPATVAVASLGPGATLRDSGEAIREMLREQGVRPPAPPSGADSGYTTALWALSLDCLSVGEFSVLYYRSLPAWDEQGELERKLSMLLAAWEQENDGRIRAPIAAEIRELAAQAIDSGTA